MGTVCHFQLHSQPTGTKTHELPKTDTNRLTTITMATKMKEYISGMFLVHVTMHTAAVLIPTPKAHGQRIKKMAIGLKGGALSETNADLVNSEFRFKMSKKKASIRKSSLCPLEGLTNNLVTRGRQVCTDLGMGCMLNNETNLWS